MVAAYHSCIAAVKLERDDSIPRVVVAVPEIVPIHDAGK